MSEHVTTSLNLHRSPLDTAIEVLQRAVALSCLVFGVIYWIRLMGLFDGPEWRFDLMPIYWQATAAPLAVLFPFAAVGLWMLASWGPVIWALCAGTEIVMYGLFPSLFGSRPGLILLHVAVALIYAVLRAAIFIGKRRSGD